MVKSQWRKSRGTVSGQQQVKTCCTRAMWNRDSSQLFSEWHWIPALFYYLSEWVWPIGGLQTSLCTSCKHTYICSFLLTTCTLVLIAMELQWKHMFCHHFLSLPALPGTNHCFSLLHRMLTALLPLFLLAPPTSKAGHLTLLALTALVTQKHTSIQSPR